MKRAFLNLCAGLALSYAAAPSQAQEFAAPTVASTAVVTAESTAPLVLVYLAKRGDNALPRIALGLEKPALKVVAFEKCVRVSTANPNLLDLAAQLKTEDTQTLLTAIKALGAPDARELPNVVIWFATPDNKALDCIDTSANSEIEPNLTKGVFLFSPHSEEPIVRYLDGKLHPQ